MSITIKDIAEIAQVSIATVSKVINGKTHDISAATIEKVQAIVDEMNYIPNIMARSMVTNKSKTIGLIIPDIRNSFFTEVARGAEDESYSKGYSLIFANSDDKIYKEIQHINMMNSKQVDGLLIAGSSERNPNKEISTKSPKPAIAIDRMTNYKFIISTITTQNTEGAYKAVDYLIQKGHKKILHLAGPEDNVVSIERLNGYVQAHIDNKLDIDSNNIIYGPFSTSSGYDRLIDLKNINDYTAIFASNDMIAFGALSALNERNIKVPKKISLVGVDNVEYSALVYPSLTTVDQSAYNLGKISARVLIQHLENKEIKERYHLEQKLIERKSVKNNI